VTLEEKFAIVVATAVAWSGLKAIEPPWEQKDSAVCKSKKKDESRVSNCVGSFFELPK